MKIKVFSILALLLFVSTGAWAQSALTGAFTINADGDQVQFSSGNLQATYNGSSWSWAFAANQWDFIGNSAGNTSINGNGTVSENGTVDLFGWVGASSTWTGAAQYGISNSTATNNTDGYGNNDSEALKSDWGNTIGTGWRTLTSAEWTYLFNTRTVNGGKGSGKSYTLNATVGSKMGVVIYPDNYTGSVYDGSDWASFEAAGCVFLPAAGYRNGSSVSAVGSVSYYWSSSPNTSNVNSAYDVAFNSGGLYPAISGNRSYGFSVRLVKTYETPVYYMVTMKAGTEDVGNWTIDPASAKKGETVTVKYTGTKKVKSVKAVKKAAEPSYTLLSAATMADYRMVVCAAGHLHTAKTAVPSGCTAVGILGKVTSTGHGLILALQDATAQTWNTINGWSSVTTYASTALKLLPDNTARGANLTSYTTLGSTTVSNWAVAQKSDYEAIFANLGSTTGDNDGKTFDANVNAYITTGVGGTAISGGHWSATDVNDDYAWNFRNDYWNIQSSKTTSLSVRPVLGF